MAEDEEHNYPPAPEENRSKIVDISSAPEWKRATEAESSPSPLEAGQERARPVEFAAAKHKLENKDHPRDVIAAQIEVARQVTNNHKFLKDRFAAIEHDLLPDLAKNNAAAAELTRVKIQQDLMALDDHRRDSMTEVAREKSLTELDRIRMFDQNFFADMTKRADRLEQGLSRERDLAEVRNKIINFGDYQQRREKG